MIKPLSFLKRNSSTILTILGAVGVVATTVTAVRVTPKAVTLLEYAEEEKGEELTKLEAIKIAGPVYIPSIAIGAATITCIFGSNILNKHTQASLMSAYALLDNSYKEYRRKVQEVIGVKKEHQIKEEIVKERYDDNRIIHNDDTCMFFDFNTLEYFEAPMSDVIQKTTMEDGMEVYIITSPTDCTRPEDSYYDHVF